MSQILARRPRSVAVAFTIAAALGACSVAANLATSPSASDAAPTPTASGSAPPSADTATTAADAWLVVGQRGEPGLRVVLASTREQLVELPMGVPAERWRQVVTTTTEGDVTRVDEIVVQPDLPAWRSRSVDGAWKLPGIGQDPLPGGVSVDGSTIVLVESTPHPERTATRFAILANDDPARVIELPGSLEFDALSPDGSILYVIEHLPAPPEARYQVRAVDVPTGLMRDTVIVDKRNVDASMGGYPITQETHANGVVFTLYRGAGHSFIHALHSKEAWAICLGLPTFGQDDVAALLDWGIGQSDDGRRVFAANATLGLAVEINPVDLSIRQETGFEAGRTAATIELAKFGHQETGPVGRRVVVSPDGSTLFAAGAGGIVRLETGHLTVEGRLLEGTAVDGLALTLDGATLFALTHDGRILRLDTQTGSVLGQVPGDGYDRLVGIASWS
jgi:hypothetical protein